MKSVSCRSCERRRCSRIKRKTGKDGANYENDVFYKQVVSKIKNMLAFLHLEIVNLVFSLHSDVYSFLHAILLNHKITKLIILLK